MAAKARRGALRHPFLELKAWLDFHRASGKERHLEMVIDREHDRYFKRAVDPETGETVHLLEEPLSEHRGRGSARRKRGTGG